MYDLIGFKNTFFCWLLLLLSCGNHHQKEKLTQLSGSAEELSSLNTNIIIAANKTSSYLPMLMDKTVAVVANQTSVIFKSKSNSDTSLEFTHLIDSMLSSKVNIEKVFAPEHGFRGKADAGEHVMDGIDTKTKLPVISLYGKNRKPSKEQLAGIDVVLFDIQDVGVRFYTYIATLQLVMEACASNGTPVIVLDRPNPNANYIDGPTMEKEHRGFLGLAPIPLVYGMTIGEYANMINNEGWLEGQEKADLTVITLENYTHNSNYDPPIRPSPNLPNLQSIKLYPSLGLFEGTNINAGRGTENQFQRFGAPFLDSTFFDFNYTPIPNFGSKTPKQLDKLCYGRDLSEIAYPNEVSLKWILEAYNQSSDKSLFFNKSGFTKHAGTEKLQEQIEAGWTEERIKSEWASDLETFKQIRKKYLLYP
jgi:uncharacterized protein YbbC (DUF1343 family)